jgi:hypothetical protein
MSTTLQTLNEMIHHNTDQRFFVSRVAHSIKNVFSEKGCLTGGAMIGAITAAKVYTLAFAYFCMEGTVRSIIDARDIGSLIARPLGDAGGWNSLALFSLLAFGTFTVQMVREGEYLQLKKLFLQWLEKSPDNKRRVYGAFNEILDAFNGQCFLAKNVVSRRLMALQVMPESYPDQQDKHFRLDKKLQTTFTAIKSDIEKMTGSRYYCHRIYAGQCSIVQAGGYSRQLGSLILGVAIPLILLTGAFISLMGQLALGHELFVEREDLTAIGHFGEWPFNFIEAIGVAFFLHLWCMINEGDFVITRDVYKQHIGALQNDRECHNRLCDVANEELGQSSSACHYFKLPLDYKFEKIETPLPGESA